jgi:phosphatidylinositol alpha-mannosyltransferase
MASGRPLRIGLVCPYSFGVPGGVQNHVLGLARYLTELGHHALVLGPGELSPSAAQALGRDRFTGAGTAVPVRYNGSVARVNIGPRSAARVHRWLRDGAFDLLHIHEPMSPSVALLALCAAEQPVVATFHAATPRSRTLQLAGGLLRAALGKLDAAVAVSESARLVVKHLGRDALVIPNGLRVADFTGRPDAVQRPVRRPPGCVQSRGDTPRAPRVVFLGRTEEPRKGLDVLLAAVPLVRAAVGHFELVVAGHGAGVLPAGSTRLGPVSDEVRAELLASADVFVAPHRARESFGIVLVEALASGAAVIASDLPAFVDLLTGGRRHAPVGTLFPVGDHRALAGAMVSVLRERSPIQVAATRQRGIQFAARFDWSRVGAAVLSLYRAVLDAEHVRRLPGHAREPQPFDMADDNLSG